MTNLDSLEKKSTENDHRIIQQTEESDKITDPTTEDDISPIVLILCTTIPMIILIILFL